MVLAEWPLSLLKATIRGSRAALHHHADLRAQPHYYRGIGVQPGGPAHSGHPTERHHSRGSRVTLPQGRANVSPQSSLVTASHKALGC